MMDYLFIISNKNVWENWFLCWVELVSPSIKSKKLFESIWVELLSPDKAEKYLHRKIYMIRTHKKNTDMQKWVVFWFFTKYIQITALCGNSHKSCLICGIFPSKSCKHLFFFFTSNRDVFCKSQGNYFKNSVQLKKWHPNFYNEMKQKYKKWKKS